jgi:hypothetical protein
MTTEKQIREGMNVISEQLKSLTGMWEDICEAYDIAPKFGDKFQNIRTVKATIIKLEALLQLILKETKTVTEGIDKLEGEETKQ